MYKTHTIRVPRPYKAGPLPRSGSYIIMEFIELGASKGGQAEIGRQLAEMHNQGVSNQGFGFFVDNTIGSTPQPNPWEADWIPFFRDHRLGFQLDLIRQQYADNDLFRKGQKVMGVLDSVLGGIPITPCLLRGDLWSGNMSADREGKPVILDPAVYYGHAEAEFGMSWCAGFGASFYGAYHEVIPRIEGHEERAELYKLYHYLNHYNMFGSSYRSSCMSIINKFV